MKMNLELLHKLCPSQELNRDILSFMLGIYLSSDISQNVEKDINLLIPISLQSDRMNL